MYSRVEVFTAIVVFLFGVGVVYLAMDVHPGLPLTLIGVGFGFLCMGFAANIIYGSLGEKFSLHPSEIRKQKRKSMFRISISLMGVVLVGLGILSGIYSLVKWFLHDILRI